MKRKLTFAVVLVLVLALFAVRARRAHTRTPETQMKEPYYMIKASIFESMPRRTGSIVFLGDSITDYACFGEVWPELDIRNRGIAGDTTVGVLNRLDEVISLKPAKLFIMIGTNDVVFGLSPDKIAGNIREIITRIKAGSPDTRIFLESTFPTNNKDFKTGRPNETLKALNAKLESLASELGCTFLNIYPLLLVDGELGTGYTIDGLHLNGTGNMKWAEYLEPYVKE